MTDPSSRITCSWCRYLTSTPSTPVTVTLSLKCVIIVVILLVLYTIALIMFLELRHSNIHHTPSILKNQKLDSIYPSLVSAASSYGSFQQNADDHGSPSTQRYHYGIVIDCGSSGSRVYVYQWPTHSGNPNELLHISQLRETSGEPVVKKITPGLSTFASNPSAASKYLHPLLSYAAKNIPEGKHSETLLYILATAGMRVLPASAQASILEELQTSIPKYFKFVVAKNNFEVITGKQEGVYGWIAVNYILNKFAHGIEVNCDAGTQGENFNTISHVINLSVPPNKVNLSEKTLNGINQQVNSSLTASPVSNTNYLTDHPLVVVDVSSQTGSVTPHIRRRTVGVIDMGGGSMQIAFEVIKSVKFDFTKEDLAKDLMAEFNLGCRSFDLDHNYQLYVSTFLGFGANSARRRYEEMLLNDGTNSSQGFDKLSPVPDPCLPLGLLYTSATNTQQKTFFIGLGDYALCRRNIFPLLNVTVPCQKKPCSMNGIYQSDINFHNSEFYGFSEFWYSMEDVYRIGGHYNADIFDKISVKHCATRWAKLEEWFLKKLYPKSDILRLKLQCFKAAWMSLVLHDGLKFPRTYRHFYSTQKIDGKDVQWTLGALIHRTRYLPLRHTNLRFGNYWTR
ncbi:ectonucleoside triphosphate diphosphohydrolase 7 isoform X2 [Octopus bimaculoides]|uniref:ectonucleoside triphosphate diphosphohydrolase 7 isoform X2 n=1 Tax=Octopus bimaculoides TaxID=37653 RepID=UPI00071DE8B0|nr:ectonucleoside triphosphate diphosphohydrolase 7 isoform X2 [Octopus bimaculoides]|eukprot:XP_014777473.1 PREDICTED: ectonucleoside triphosphate diphosphohydrolase 7-like isoform X2 [Octopus bimaculoides]